MRTFFLAFLQFFLLISAACGATAATIFEDGFESGALGPQWTVSGSNDGRVTVSTNFAPATGQWHLILDDSVTDAISSSAEAIVRLDLSNKRNVALSFKSLFEKRSR